MSDDLVKKALASDEDDELEQSNKLAETLISLQNLIERHALELTKINGELSEKRESVRDVFDNDTLLTEKKDEL
ncbi:MAG: hypothetical protein GX943_00905, partial [Candidatus Pacebacteria bacterium]|nr:hypothetical protein [Candidatus Paceibacterota bacterium]